MGKLEEIEEAVKNGEFREYQGAVSYLLSEVHRLKDAIKKHKYYMWGEDGLVEHPADQELYKAIEEE